MALGDLTQNVMLRIKADPDHAVRGLEKYQAKVKAAGNEAATLGAKASAAFKGIGDSLGKANQAFEVFGKASGYAKSALDSYAKSSSAAKAEVDKLNASASKIGDTFSSALGKTLVKLEPFVSGLGTAVGWLDRMQVAGPLAVGALATALSGNPIIGGTLGLFAWAAGGESPGGLLAKNGFNFVRTAGDIYKLNTRGGATSGTSGVGAFGTAMGGLNGLSQLISDGVVFGLGKAGITPWSPFEAKSSGAGRPARVGNYLGRRSMDFGAAGSGSTTVGLAAQYGDAFGLDTTGYANAATTNRWKAELDYYNQRGADSKSALEQTFGPLAQFDAYATAFQTLSGAVGSAMSAWIDGSMSAGKAFKAFVAEAVKGLAVQMSIEALKNGAYAVGSLIPGTPFFNPAAAAGYAKTAALFAAGAVAAGVAAKGLGGSGGAPATGGGYSGSAPSTVGPTAGSDRSGAERIVVIGDSFAEDSPRNQQRKAQRMVRRALGSSHSRPN